MQVLVPSPSPLPSLPTTPIPPSSKPSSRPSTTVHTPLDTPTPRSEPIQQTRYITPHEACVIFLRSLHQSASDFLGHAPSGVVLSVPKSFDDTQRAALLDAAREAGLKVIQLLEEAVAAAAVLVDPQTPGSDTDKTTLLVDWGSSDLTITLLSIRSGLVHVLGSRSAPELGSAQPGSIDEVLIKYFAKEFSKKTGEALPVCPPTPSSARAQTKLALALPALKRSLTAAILRSAISGGVSGADATKSAQLSIESLYAGLDFNAPLNRVRAGALLGPIWVRFSEVVKNVFSDATSSSGTDVGIWLDTIAFIGGTGALASAAGASSTLLASGLFGTRQTDEEEVHDEDLARSPQEVIACGLAIHARSVLNLDEQVREVVLQHVLTGGVPKEVSDVKVTSLGIALIIPTDEASSDQSQKENGNADSKVPSENLGGHFIPLLPPNTPFPTKRTMRFQISLSSSSANTSTLPLEVYEYTPSVRTHVVPPIVYSDAEDDDEPEEPEEPEEERYRAVTKGAYLGHLQLTLSPVVAVDSTPGASKKKSNSGKSNSAGSGSSDKTIEILVNVSGNGKVEIAAREAKEESQDGWAKLSLVFASV